MANVLCFRSVAPRPAGIDDSSFARDGESRPPSRSVRYQAQLHLNTAMGRLLWAIQGWYAEMENEERSENVRAGQARARAQGKQIGRPPEIDAAQAEEIVRLRASGLWVHSDRESSWGVADDGSADPEGFRPEGSLRTNFRPFRRFPEDFGPV